MAKVGPETHVIAHSHSFGTSRYLFVPPEGFEVPYGAYGSDDPDWEGNGNLLALVSFLDIDFQPELMETLEVAQLDEEIHEPTLRELQKLMPTPRSAGALG